MLVSDGGGRAANQCRRLAGTENNWHYQRFDPSNSPPWEWDLRSWTLDGTYFALATVRRFVDAEMALSKPKIKEDVLARRKILRTLSGCDLNCDTVSSDSLAGLRVFSIPPRSLLRQNASQRFPITRDPVQRKRLFDALPEMDLSDLKIIEGRNSRHSIEVVLKEFGVHVKAWLKQVSDIQLCLAACTGSACTDDGRQGLQSAAASIS